MLTNAAIRPRVCGLCIENDQVLMLKHEPGFRMPYFWLPPGGGVELGETLEAALEREFVEETGLKIAVEKFLFVNQFVHLPFHALEFFFLVRRIGGSLAVGYDPEFEQNAQIIQEVRFMNFAQIQRIEQTYLHNVFWNCASLSDLLAQQGLFSLVRS
jgi:8-oxo-dGTP diphosphatase